MSEERVITVNTEPIFGVPAVKGAVAEFYENYKMWCKEKPCEHALGPGIIKKLRFGVTVRSWYIPRAIKIVCDNFVDEGVVCLDCILTNIKVE